MEVSVMADVQKIKALVDEKADTGLILALMYLII